MRWAVVALLVLTACAGPETSAPDSTNTTTPAPTTSETVAPVATDPTTPDRPETTVTPPPIIGEVPDDLLDAILDDARERTGAEEIEVLRAEAVTWPDGSLGCPEPDVLYPQVLTPGYWVELLADGARLDYRASEKGFFRLCENPLKRPPATGVDPDV